MSTFVKKYPAISMIVLSSVFGAGVVVLVSAGLLPESLFRLAASSATVGGLILTAIVAGKAGLRDLFGRILIWRVGGGWWAFAVFAILGVVILGIVVNALFGLDPLDLSRIPQGLVSVVPIFVMRMITSGLGEELGWRGFLLPRLQTRYNALVASLIVGIFWGIWHIPLFFIGVSPYKEIAEAFGVGGGILGYGLFYVTSWSILFTFLLNNTKGSLLLAFALHASQAWVVAFGNMYNPLGFIGLASAMTIAAIIVVLVYGPENLSKTSERYVIKDA